MHYVRALCTKISAAIFRMVQNLNEMSPGDYERLFERFKDIQQKINPHLSPPQVERGGPLVLALSEVRRDDVERCGSKMAMLGDAAATLSVPTPPGFVITAEGYRRFIMDSGLKEEIDRRIQSSIQEKTHDAMRMSSSIMQLVVEAELPADLEQAILDAYATVERESESGIPMAVRSSALGEDAEGATFAGQYRSVLNVDADSLLDAYREVVASKWSVEACAYRASRGIRDEDVAMCVGFMGMVDAKSSGVAYSSSPVDFEDHRVRIYSVWGLPKAVVDGSTATDEFRVSRDPQEIETRSIAEKQDRYACLPREGTCRLETTQEEANAPSLEDGQVLAVARLAVSLEKHFNHPQDVEWAYDHDNTLMLLQCRPLTEVLEETKAEIPEGLPDPVFKDGVVASPGVAAGEIRTVLKDADALTFPEGAVLMLRHALPRRAALLNRAVAVIAEQGSAAGHLANVAREFGIPAVFGLRGILDEFEDGETLTIDADSGAIYRDRQEPLLERKRVRRDLMRGSPVRAALLGAARHILRLRLLDPDSVEFRARNCKTFHDIMRFCHEKAVKEMFHLGMSRSVQQVAARRVICDVPKQFWILDLGDAFCEEGACRMDGCVAVDQIRSLPMRALWDGMMAVAWEGPPPVNASGFMSVLFEATANPNLDSAGRSEYSTRNYFMASRRYCSLQSRFGFHFCGTESYVGERPAESYASFQFKGGAADLKRRILRTRFIAQILENYDFGVKLREDNLFARVEGLEQEGMLRRLRVIGYLISHTRQIDMIMADPDAVERRRQSIEKDLAELVGR
ncbi:PEP/pyruvate-binding domain-containing protein [Salidesulfovibrio brasiliensis]|uniref:PEP/pyruvate-binding domain-containing protein n=1 Tax=Salidesulfovibrio brasiliensis TaxID=221711 RepID=UPI000A843C1E|nr:PEP/pyruvate-binding domain-containing protein [Salidesulfovibrio brasiliensis]